MITGEQMRGGRAMLGWDQSELAEKADVSLKTIKRMEATSGLIDARSTWAVKRALEIAGIEFLDGDDHWRNRGEGVRFSKDPTGKLRRAIVNDVTLLLPVRLKSAVEEDQDFFERPIDTILDTVGAEVRDLMKSKLQSLLNRDA